MPHVSSSGGDDLGSTDEVKVFKDEGDGEDEKRSSENLTEEKSSLIDLTESEVRTAVRPLLRPADRSAGETRIGRGPPPPRAGADPAAVSSGIAEEAGRFRGDEPL